MTDLSSLHGTYIAPLNETQTPIRLAPYAPTQLLHADVLILGKTVHAEDKSHGPIRLSVRLRYAKAGEPAGEVRDVLPSSVPGPNGYQFATMSHLEDIYRIVAGSHISRLVYARVDEASDGTPGVRRASYGLPPSVLYQDTDSDEEDLPRGSSWDTREPTTEASGRATHQSPLSPYYSPASPLPPSPVLVRTASPRSDYYAPSEQEYGGVYPSSSPPYALSPASPAYARSPSFSPSPSPHIALSAGPPSATAVVGSVLDRARHRILNSASIHSDHMDSVSVTKERVAKPSSPLWQDHDSESDPMELGHDEVFQEDHIIKSVSESRVSVRSVRSASLSSESPEDDVAVQDDSEQKQIGPFSFHDDRYQDTENPVGEMQSGSDDQMFHPDCHNLPEEDRMVDHCQVSEHDNFSDQGSVKNYQDEAGFGDDDSEAEEESIDDDDKENRFDGLEHHSDDEDQDDHDSDNSNEDPQSPGMTSDDDDRESDEEMDELDDDEASSTPAPAGEGPLKVETAIGRMAEDAAGETSDANEQKDTEPNVEEVKYPNSVKSLPPPSPRESAAELRRRTILASMEAEDSSVGHLQDESSDFGDEDSDMSSSEHSDSDPDSMNDSGMEHSSDDDESMDNDSDDHCGTDMDEDSDREDELDGHKPLLANDPNGTDNISDPSRREALERLKAARAGKRWASVSKSVTPPVDVKQEIKTEDVPRHRASTYEEGLLILREAYKKPSYKSISTVAELDGPTASSYTPCDLSRRQRAASPCGEYDVHPTPLMAEMVACIEEASMSFANFQNAQEVLDSASDVSSVGLVTPPTVTKTLKRARTGEDESDDDIIVVTPSKKFKSTGSVTPAKSSIAKTVGWVVLGAALGSAGTIAGLMRIGAESTM